MRNPVENIRFSFESFEVNAAPHGLRGFDQPLRSVPIAQNVDLIKLTVLTTTRTLLPN